MRTTRQGPSHEKPERNDVRTVEPMLGFHQEKPLRFPIRANPECQTDRAVKKFNMGGILKYEKLQLVAQGFPQEIPEPGILMTCNGYMMYTCNHMQDAISAG
jgi:hypothetical protein